DRDTGQDSAELLQRLTDPDSGTGQGKIADAALVRAAALLQYRDRLTNHAAGLEVAQDDDRVGQVAGVDRRLHLHADQAVLRADQKRGDTGLAEERQQLVQLDDQELLVRHRVEIAVEAVDDDDPGVVLRDRPADVVNEFAGRQLRGVDLAHADPAGIDMRLEVHAHAGAARKQRLDALVEDKQRRALAPPGGSQRRLQRGR